MTESLDPFYKCIKRFDKRKKKIVRTAFQAYKFATFFTCLRFVMHATNLDLPATHVSAFEKIANDIYTLGYCILIDGLPAELAESLYIHNQQMSDAIFEKAGIGRSDEYHTNRSIRRDEICWIDGYTPTGQMWLSWCAELQQYLNRRLLLGLHSFESHFAHYKPGMFYKRHYDAFKGSTNRVLSLVTYLNKHWHESDGGQLVIYKNDTDKTGIRVQPAFGTIAVFLSEDFPHEVLPATRDRYSIAGWFRVNGSHGGAIDPPR